jgi:hypothetical protein
VLSSWASKIILAISLIAGLSVARRISAVARQEHAFQRANGGVPHVRS